MSVLDFLNGHPRPLHRFILLDHMDWLAAYGKPILAAEWQAIAEHAAPDALAHYLAQRRHGHRLREFYCHQYW